MRRAIIIGLTVTAIILQGIWTVTAQQIASVAELKSQIDRLEALVRDPQTPTEFRPSNLRLLAEKRAQLRASLQNQIGALRGYQTAYQHRFSATESQTVNTSIRLLEGDLLRLEQRKPLVATPAEVPRTNHPVTSEASRSTARGSMNRAPIGSRTRGETADSDAAPSNPRFYSERQDGVRIQQVQSDSQRKLNSQRSRVSDQCSDASGNNSIYLDWNSGSISPSRLKRSGTYCFNLNNANTILYSYAFTVSALEPQGSPLGILKDAIGEIKDLIPKAAGNAQGLSEPECPLGPFLTTLRQAATDLETVMSPLLPKPSGGKIPSIPLETTLAAWEPVPAKFRSLEAAANTLSTELHKTPDNDLCRSDIKKANEALEAFYQIRAAFSTLQSKVMSDHVVRFRDDLDSTKGYDVVVRELYSGRATEADAKTYHLTAGYSVISSSAGFMLTQVPARSYSSVTAPNPAAPTTTQNVLGVDFGGGRRLVLAALLHYNLPVFWKRQIGLGVSAGPVFDISGGKAETSRFGFFAGPSLRLSEWVYLTPGFHVGEFADFPQGFAAPGQIIPAGTGTPTPVKRYTTRFAFGITFKVKDLVGSGNSSSSASPASQPKPK